jgi:S1-C subfamily serine protease
MLNCIRFCLYSFSQFVYLFLISCLLIILNTHNILSKDLSLAKKLQKAIPSVVSIYASNYSNPKETDIFLKSDIISGSRVSAGSGVIITEDGILITNNHVISGKNAIKIILEDGRTFIAKLIQSNSDLDLALLQIELDTLDNIKFQPINIISSKDVLIGETIFAIGNPFGVGISVTSGIVSALPNDKAHNKISLGSLIQVDAPMNPGSSGGALIDSDGNLIGINSSIFTKTGSFIGIGFAIPSDIVNLFIQRVLSGKQIKQFWLGLSAVNITNEIAKAKGLQYPRGIIITSINKGGPAAKSGLQIGDVILKLDGKDIDTISDITFIVASLESSYAMNMEIFRKSERKMISITPSIPLDLDPSSIIKVTDGNLKGIDFISVDQAIEFDVFHNSSLKEGVIVYNIEPNSLAYKLGLRRGDNIYSINGRAIQNIKQLTILLKEFNSSNRLQISFQRAGSNIDVSI